MRTRLDDWFCADVLMIVLIGLAAFSAMTVFFVMWSRRYPNETVVNVYRRHGFLANLYLIQKYPLMVVYQVAAAAPFLGLLYWTENACRY